MGGAGRDLGVAEKNSLSEVAVTAAFLSIPPTLFVSFLTVFTLDWKSGGMRLQISPEFIFARSSDFSQPPALVSVAFMRGEIPVEVVRNVSPA